MPSKATIFMIFGRKRPRNLPVSKKGFTFVGKFRYNGKIAHISGPAQDTPPLHKQTDYNFPEH